MSTMNRNMNWRSAPGVAAGVGAIFFLAAILTVNSAAVATEPADRGRRLVTDLCSACHAVGRSGSSPLANAPQFRKIGDRLDINELAERMRAGLSSTHRGMPTFRFSRADTQAVRAYLHSIQE